MSERSTNPQAAFRVGRWLIRPAANEVEKGAAAPFRVEGRVMEVLTCLLEQPGQVLTKDELISRVWQDVFVSDDALFRCIREIRRIFEDDPREPRFVETIPRKGYRWIAPAEVVDEAASRQEDKGGRPGQSGVPLAGRRSGRLAGVLLPALIAWILLGYFSGPDSDIESIAVLPFLVLEPAGSTEDLGVRVADSIAYQLSELEGVRVISSMASIHYRGQRQIDPRQVAKELGVGTLLLGKISALNGQVSISVEAVDGSNSGLVWGRTFRGSSEDLPELQERVAGAVLALVGARLSGGGSAFAETAAQPLQGPPRG